MEGFFQPGLRECQIHPDGIRLSKRRAVLPDDADVDPGAHQIRDGLSVSPKPFMAVEIQVSSEGWIIAQLKTFSVTMSTPASLRSFISCSLVSSGHCSGL